MRTICTAFTAFFFRLLVPVSLALSFSLRANGFSALFLLLYFIHPFIESPGRSREQFATKLYLGSILLLSSLFLTAQIILILYSSIDGGLPSTFSCNENTTNGQVWKEIGLEDLQNSPWWYYFVYLGPEAVMILCSVCSLLLHSLSIRSNVMYSRAASQQGDNIARTTAQTYHSKFQKTFAPLICVFNIAALIAAASCVPSLISLCYLIIFIVLGTGNSLTVLNFFTTGISSMSYTLVFLSAAHITTIYVFQFNFLSDSVDYEDTWLRLTGINLIFNNSCNAESSDDFKLYVDGLTASEYLQPIVLLILYYLMAHYTGYWATLSVQSLQTSLTGDEISSMQTRSHVDRIPAPIREKSDAFLRPLKKAAKLVEQAVRSQYYLLSVAVQILWSVWCHGIIALILLIVAIYLWGRSNSQIRTLRTAPFLIIFCPLYLIIQYIFSFNYHKGEFVEEQFDFKIAGYNLTLSWEDIRLTTNSMPITLYLGVQCVFMCVFWASMRNYIFYRQDLNRNLHVNTSSPRVTQNDNNQEISDNTEITNPGSRSNISQAASAISAFSISDTVKETASAIWMSVCLAVLLFVSTYRFPTAVNIIYMFFFLSFTNYTVFRVASGSVRVPDFEKFLRFILLFTMIVLVVVYILRFSFIFDQVEFFEDHKEILSELGFTSDASDIFKVVLPIALLLIVMKIQFDFFSDSFKSFTQKFCYQIANEDDQNLEGFDDAADNANVPASGDQRKTWKVILKDVKEFVWLVLAIHTDKIFLIIVFSAIIQEVSAINFMFLLFYILLCVTPSSLSEPLRGLLFLLTCAVILARMVYQNKLIHDLLDFNVTCPETSLSESNLLQTDLMEWIGFKVYGKDDSSFVYLWFYLLIILWRFAESLIHCRMHCKLAKWRRDANRFTENGRHDLALHWMKEVKDISTMLTYRMMFRKGVRQNADRNFTNMCKFIFNFIFYKFGLEISVLAILINCATHGDAYSALYLIIVLSIILSRRRNLRSKVFALSLVTGLCLSVKFIFLLWLPPFKIFCHWTPINWVSDNGSTFNLLIKRFFFVPDFEQEVHYSIKSDRLRGDLIQLLILRYFLINLADEKVSNTILGLNNIADALTSSANRRKHLPEIAGNNDECLDESPSNEQALGNLNEELRRQRVVYSRSNFLTDEKDALNVVKKIIFHHGIWATYAIICVTGMQDVDVFGLLFFFLAFYLLWLGQDIALLPRTKMLRKLNVILVYTLTTCILRVLLQIVAFSCFTSFFQGQDQHHDWQKFLEIFDVKLLHKYLSIIRESGEPDCTFYRLENDMFPWEIVCIFIVLLQRRIFVSHYYDFVMQEAKITRVLSRKGAKLIRQFSRKDMKARKEMRNQISDDLKEAVEKIKQRFEGGSWTEPKYHMEAIFAGERFFKGVPKEAGDALIDLEENEKMDFFNIFGDTGTVKDDVRKKWQEFIDYISNLIPQSKKDAEENDQENDCSEETFNTTSKTQQSLQSQTSKTQQTLSKAHYYVIYVVTIVLSEVGVVLDRVSFNFRRVIRELSVIRKQLPLDNNTTTTTTETPVTSTGVEQATENAENGAVIAPESVYIDLAANSADEGAEIGLDSNELNDTAFPGDEHRKKSTPERPCDVENIAEYLSLLAKTFWLSVYYFLVAQTDYLCYFMITMSLLLNGSLCEMVLAIVTLCWGILSKPRPSKNFWCFCIVYEASLLLIKFFLKLRILDSMDYSGVELVFGVSGDESEFVTNLLVMITLCFHRNLLLNFGLWIDYKAMKNEIVEIRQTSEACAKQTNEVETDEIPKTEAGFSGQNENTGPESLQTGDTDRLDTLSVSSTDESQSTAGENPSSQLLIDVTDDAVEETQIGEPVEGENPPKNSFLDKTSRKLHEIKDELLDFVFGLIDVDNTAVKDVYAPMFFFDAMGYLVVLFGYNGFSVSDDTEVSSGGTLVSIVSENRVPVLFLAIILVLFIYQMLDRLAYLTKNVRLKLALFISQVFLVHLWLIILNRKVTGRYFSENRPAQVFYFFRWVYWLLSAYQIKCSYPVRILGNCFSKDYNLFFKVCMIVFVNIPFAFEIRVLMDWVFTGTTLTFFRWLEVEDVFVTTFILNCTRIAEENGKQKRGEKQKVFPTKIIYFSLLILLWLVIWGPILLFSFLNATRVSTEINYTDFKLQIGSYLPIFEASQTGIEIIGNDKNFTDSLSKELTVDASVLKLNFYNHEIADYAKISYSGTSESVWGITAPAREQLKNDVNDTTQDILLYVEYSFSRVSTSNEATKFTPSAKGFTTTPLDDDTRQKLVDLLSDTADDDADSSVEIPAVIPSVYYFSSVGSVDNKTVTADREGEWYNIKLSMNKADSNCPQCLQWWLLGASRSSAAKYKNSFDIYVVTEKVVPDMYSAVASYGILGLYTAFVLLISSAIKKVFTGSSTKIIWSEIPDVTLLQTLTKEIYLCRETGNLELEEDLYSQLQYLYRSPETLISHTKYKLKQD